MHKVIDAFYGCRIKSHAQKDFKSHIEKRLVWIHLNKKPKGSKLGRAVELQIFAKLELCDAC